MMRWQNKHPIGLDIDSSAVRMVQVRKEGSGYVVTKAGVAEIAPWGRDPQLHRIHTVRAIVDGLARSGMRSRFAVCGLRGPEVVVRGFDFPALLPEEIPGAVDLEVAQICPFLAEESTCDFQVTSSGAQRTKGYWVAATNSLIQDTRRLIAEAGLRCALVDVTGLALLNLLACTGKREDLPPPSPESRRPGSESAESPARAGGPLQRNRPALLNIGASCATIAIADAGGRPFVRDMGGGAPSGDAGGSLAVAERWAAPTEDRSATNDTLVEDVATTLRFYHAQNSAARIDRLLVCGGPAAAEYLPPLHLRLGIDVQWWDPLADGGFGFEDGGVQGTTEAPASSDGSALAVATGLALRSI